MINLDLNQCSERVLKAYAEDATNLEHIKQLLKEKEEVVYVELAGNQHTDEETLRYLYDKYASSAKAVSYNAVFRAMLNNLSVPKDILIELAKKITDKDQTKKLLDNPSLPKEAIDILFEKQGKVFAIAEKMVAHKNTSPKTLIKIAEKHEYIVREVLKTGKVKLVES